MADSREMDNEVMESPNSTCEQASDPAAWSSKTRCICSNVIPADDGERASRKDLSAASGLSELGSCSIPSKCTYSMMSVIDWADNLLSLARRAYGKAFKFWLVTVCHHIGSNASFIRRIPTLYSGYYFSNSSILSVQSPS